MREIIYKNFEPINLNKMDQVKFMDRIDQKFCVNIFHLKEILRQIQKHYFLLEIGNKRILSYSNIYYDTVENKMYHDHVRGKNFRYKIRQRTYNNSSITFLEIKLKNNKNKTFKKRVECNGHESLFSNNLTGFISQNSPYCPSELVPILKNNFNRITLVSKKMNERCTIDFNIAFKQDFAFEELNHIAIIELKSEGYNRNSKLLQTLRALHLPPSGFSKYCFGRSVLDQDVKNNNYRDKVRQIRKLALKSNIAS